MYRIPSTTHAYSKKETVFIVSGNGELIPVSNYFFDNVKLEL